MEIYYLALKVLKKIYLFFFRTKKYQLVFNTEEAEVTSKKIYNLLVSDKPCMIARFGSTESNIIKNYNCINYKNRSITDYITDKSKGWWWNKSILRNFNVWSGFFPLEISLVEKYCELVISDVPQIDMVPFWNLDNYLFKNELKNTLKVQFEYLEPFFLNNPWTKALENKKVLVIHPFQKSIEKQYEKRELLFKNNLLPKFELKTIKAVQSVANEDTEFKTWFDALDHMKNQMNEIDYDIALIGCGAYGFNLAAHAKRMGKKGFHIGGVLQMLFGIIGKRWENPNQANGQYLRLFNDHWIRPMNEEKPKYSNLVENDTYW